MKQCLILLILLNNFSVFGQDRQKQIGVNITSDLNWYEDWRMGTQLTYTNQRHFISTGIKFCYPKKREFGFFGYDLNYRVYPNLPKKIFNLFFRAGIDYKRIDNSQDWKYSIGPPPTYPTYAAEWRDTKTAFALSLGYGFDLNITKNLFFSTSISAAYYWKSSDQRIFVQSNPPHISGTLYKNSSFTPILLVGMGYNFSLKRKHKA